MIDILQLSPSELQNIELRRSNKAIPGGISFESDIMRIGDISLDLDSLRILLKMDGAKKLSQISNATGTDSSLLKVTLHKLMNFGLVELVGNEATVLDESFLQPLKNAFALAVGPMAEVILEDTFEDMEVTSSDIPVSGRLN